MIEFKSVVFERDVTLDLTVRSAYLGKDVGDDEPVEVTRLRPNEYGVRVFFGDKVVLVPWSNIRSAVEAW